MLQFGLVFQISKLCHALLEIYSLDAATIFLLKTKLKIYVQPPSHLPGSMYRSSIHQRQVDGIGQQVADENSRQ